MNQFSFFFFFVALSVTFGLQKDDMVIFVEVFQKSEFLKKGLF